VGLASNVVWWQGFDEPLLNALVSQALSKNLDLAHSDARLGASWGWMCSAVCVAASKRLWLSMRPLRQAQLQREVIHNLIIAGLSFQTCVEGTGRLAAIAPDEHVKLP